MDATELTVWGRTTSGESPMEAWVRDAVVLNEDKHDTAAGQAGNLWRERGREPGARCLSCQPTRIRPGTQK